MKAGLLATSIAMVLAGCSLEGDDGAQGPAGTQGPTGAQGPTGETGQTGTPGVDGQSVGILTRLATVPTGAEVTGAFITGEGDLFFNVQHPASSNIEQDEDGKVFNKGTVGVLAGINFHNLPEVLISSPVPSSDFERQTVMSAYGQYQVLGQQGDTYEGKLAEGLGNIYNLAGDTLILENQNPDFNGYVPAGEGKGYLFTNWEMYPGGMSRLSIEKQADGTWNITDAMMVDFSPIKGTAANCFGSVTPWGTPLSSEEWIVESTVNSTTDASWNDPAQVNDSTTRLSNMWSLTAPDSPNPYDYGYIVEVTAPDAASPVPVKHFTLGRYEHENATVMPDGRTVYLSQDDTGGVLFKFIADVANDLSAGTLYGAKLTQDAGVDDPATTGFDVEWVELAHGDNATIQAWIADFNGIGTDDYVEGETSYMTVADVEAWAAGAATYPTVANGGGKVTAGEPMDNRAVFLESRAAAKAKGATAEWRKLEGISINTKRAQEAVEGIDTIPGELVQKAWVYFGISDIDNTMIDDEGDMQLSDRVKDCGGVYRAQLGENYNISRIEPLVMGATYRSSLSGASRCDVEQLSQPDNVIVLEDGRIVIGEDGFQENNTLWMYEPVEK
ncbi:alkaline phosphatase PhoX [Alteromonas sp. a30]|uniref:alkaline phosphatase PhoX n=1 Tax=Alteromonas sp. a30 TaxID=2730917 RepID=UPI003FA3B4D8